MSFFLLEQNRYQDKSQRKQLRLGQGGWGWGIWMEVMGNALAHCQHPMQGGVFDAGVVMSELSLLILPRDGVSNSDFMWAELSSKSARLGTLVWRPGVWSDLGPRWGALCLYRVTLGSCFLEC